MIKQFETIEHKILKNTFNTFNKDKTVT